MLLIILNCTIDAGGDGRSYSIKVNNETVCAFSNGKNVTDDFNRMEEDAKRAILKYYNNSKIEFIDFCHLGDTESMTVDVIVDGCMYHTILWQEGKIKSIHNINVNNEVCEESRPILYFYQTEGSDK